jgi:hypothetical protein
MPVDLSKQGIGNQSPKIRCIFHFGILDGLSRDKMQNPKVRCKTIVIYGQFQQTPWVAFSDTVQEPSIR